MVRVPDAQSDLAADRSIAELLVLDFKNTWLDFQKSGQTAT